MTQVAGKVVLVTGAGRGLGRGLSEHLAGAGARVVVTDVKEADAAETADAIRARGGTAWPFPLDVTDDASVTAARDRIRRELGAVEVLVNNAGVVFGGAFLEVPLARHRATYAVNTVGLVAVTHAFLPDLVAQPEGHLVNIASASGLLGLPFGATYASSKWAVIGFSDSLRVELGELGHRHVKVTTVCPSYIATGMFEGAEPPRLTPMLTPLQIVERVMRAIAEDEMSVLEPAMVKTLPLMKGLLPQRAFDRIAAAFGMSRTMKQWQGHGPR